jgi:hypothetical protein
MRVPLGDLEEVRRDPGAYKRKQEAPKEKGPGYGYYNLLLDSISHFHRHELSVDEGVREVVRRFDAIERLKSKRELEKTVVKFRDYAIQFVNSKLDKPLVRVQVAVRLPETFDGLQVSGQLPRVDRLLNGDTVAWVFSKAASLWDQELRLPLIQEAVADHLHAELDEVGLAVYCFEDGASKRFQFSDVRIAAARAELQGILTQLL